VFKFKKVHENEYQITDYPVRIAYFPLFISFVAFLNVFTGSNHVFDSIFIIIIALLFTATLNKVETNINLNTKAIYHSRKNIFRKKYTTINIKDVKVEISTNKNSYSHLPSIYLKDSKKDYTVITGDLFNDEETKKHYEKIKDILK
tara:strand:+ start:355 stop:792 length:438 start_codon:yes stop_codon:yes gene_type:complete